MCMSVHTKNDKSCWECETTYSTNMRHMRQQVFCGILFLLFMTFCPYLCKAQDVILYSDDLKEEQPEFPDGMSELYAFLSRCIKYPKECIEEGIQGRVFVRFYIEPNGRISNIVVIRSPDPLLTKEAVRVTKLLPRFKPGKQDGKGVRVQMTLPISFKLT